MTGIIDLDELLKSMRPEIQEGEFVFCTVGHGFTLSQNLHPLAFFVEPEGLTLILPAEKASEANLPFEGRFKQITLTVHSSLEAVGLTAAVATKLASRGISANVVAAYYHDHIFVPTERAAEAISALKELS